MKAKLEGSGTVIVMLLISKLLAVSVSPPEAPLYDLKSTQLIGPASVPECMKAVAPFSGVIVRS